MSIWPSPQLPFNVTPPSTLAIFFVGLVILIARWSLRKDPLDVIPTVGVPSYPFGSFVARFQSIERSKDWLDEGFKKHRGNIFKIRQIYGWTVIVASPPLIDELARTPEHILSFQESAAQNTESDYTLSNWRDARTEEHVGLVRGRLTKSLSRFFPVVVDEIRAACEEHFSLDTDKEWTPIVAADAVMAAIARTTNRIIVGQPMCRNRDFVALNVRFTRDVIISAMLLKLFPWWLKPVVYRYLTPMRRDYAEGMRLLQSLVEGRREDTIMHQSGADWPDKQDDMLQWTLDVGMTDTRGLELRTEFLVDQMLRLNFASLHTTAISFMHAFYQVASQPSSIQDPLRAEVEAAIAQYGWTKDGVDSMRRLDSVFRESQRFWGLGAVSMTRIAMSTYTLSNGVTLPPNTLVAAASRAAHFDEEVYDAPHEFKAFRFADIDSEGLQQETKVKQLYVTPGPHYIPFGVGKHTCPGRFWAANEMKVLMCHLLLNYEFRTEELGVPPAPRWFGPNVAPNQTAKILFKKRSAETISK